MLTDDSNDKGAAELSRQQMAVVAQLFRTVPSMHHIDELFQWLAYVIAQQFNIQLTQCWTSSINRTGQRSVQLRAMAHLDSSLPEQIVANEQIAVFAQRILHERRNFQPQLVTNILQQYQATLLRRYSLNYCAGCFLTANALLPPLDNVLAQERLPTILTMAVLLFTRQSPHIDLVPTIGTIMEQAAALASGRGLLLPTSAVPEPTPFTTAVPPPAFTPTLRQDVLPPLTAVPPPASTLLPRQDVLPPLTELIPRRKQDANLMLTANPFAGAAIIADKQARRLHAAIDGRSNIASLCTTTRMNIKEVSLALQKLLLENRIEICEPSGRIIDPSLFLNNG